MSVSELSGRTRLLLTATVSAALLSAPALPAAAAPPGGGEGALIRHLRTTAGSSLRIGRQAANGRVRFLGSATGRPIESRRGAASLSAPAVARTFLARYSDLFGASAVVADLRVLKTSKDASGAKSVRFQQEAGGVPVLGGELVVALDRHNNVLSASGETTPVRALPATAPVISAGKAAQIAVGIVARDIGADPKALSAQAPALRIYDPALLGVPGSSPAALVWAVTVTQGLAHRQVYVDAARGFVRLNFDPDPHAKVRVVCDRAGQRTATDECTPPYDLIEGGSTARASADAVNAYLYSGDTYDFYKTRFGRDSLDGKGLVLKSTVRYCPDDSDAGAPSLAPCPFPNAYWNGDQMVYGAGFASADDVVGHELTHGVTQNEANLFSLYQSGAINESISDIFGELIDQYNASVRTRGRDSDGSNGTVDYRWLLFEDGPGGVGRNMRDPTARKDPDRIRSGYYAAENEWSPKWDNGGVHANAGVGNKAAYLMAVGGTFNMRTIDPANALGNEKLAQLYYRTLTQHLTSGSDYADLADALQQSCAELVAGGAIAAAGTTLTFTVSDCATVATAVDATELRLQPLVRLRKGTAVPTGATNPEAAVCDAGLAPSYTFYDNLEHPKVGNWVTSKRVGTSDWLYPPNPNPFDLDLEYAKSGKLHMFGDDPEVKTDFAITSARAFVPTATSYLRFDHSHVFDFNYDTNLGVDSGVVEYSIDGGTTFVRLQPESGELYGPVAAASTGNNSTIHGAAFVGDSHGYVSTRFFLGDLAGRSVKIRFRIATDSRFGDFGWFVDDVRVYDCAAGVTAPAGPPPAPVITSARSAEDGIGVVWSSAAAPTGISGYLVTARSASHTVAVPVAAGTSGYTVRGLSAASPYTVTVRAYSAFGDSLSAPTGPIIPADTQPPAPPRSVVVSPGTGAAVLSWTPDPRSFYYGARVVLKAGSAAPISGTDGRAIDVAKGAGTRIGGLASGTAYTIAVFARDRFGQLGLPARTVRIEGSTLTLTADKASIVRGKQVVLAGALRDTRGVGVGARYVVLFYRPAGATAWQLYDARMTGRGGLYAFPTQLPAGGDLQVRFRGGPGVLGSLSPVTRVAVRKPPPN
ncbi:MAG: M4 family metallopeptidase [Actinomycetota bacterium]